MIRTHEAAGLTAALAKLVDRRTAELAALLSDPTYTAELLARGGWETPAPRLKAHRALHHLMEAERALRELADVLAAPAPVHAGRAALEDFDRRRAALNTIAGQVQP